MSNKDDRYDDGDNDGNEDGNDDNNTATGSGSDGPIFDPITTPRSRGGGFFDNGDVASATKHYVSTCQTIYLPYKDHIKDVP